MKVTGASMKITVLILFMLLLSAAAHGMVYCWNDSGGIMHYTNKENEIPARYRAKARPLYHEECETPSQRGQSGTVKREVRETQPIVQQPIAQQPAVQQPAVQQPAVDDHMTM
jgi:hypothetical protein